ncbi:MAG: 50S ribosomal protein L18 [Cytophagales bacterium]|nr:50S ribosomal protein L18 [Cytophagales bacterium]
MSRWASRRRIRKKLWGTPDRPRVCVFKSNRSVYVQVVDDVQGQTLVHASSREINKLGTNVSICEKIGLKLGERVLEKGIQKIVFDRGGYPYHGKVKAIAEGARKAGLVF